MTTRRPDGDAAVGRDDAKRLVSVSDGNQGAACGPRQDVGRERMARAALSVAMGGRTSRSVADVGGRGRHGPREVLSTRGRADGADGAQGHGSHRMLRKGVSWWRGSAHGGAPTRVSSSAYATAEPHAPHVSSVAFPPIARTRNALALPKARSYAGKTVSPCSRSERVRWCVSGDADGVGTRKRGRALRSDVCRRARARGVGEGGVRRSAGRRGGVSSLGVRTWWAKMEADGETDEEPRTVDKYEVPRGATRGQSRRGRRSGGGGELRAPREDVAHLERLGVAVPYALLVFVFPVVHGEASEDEQAEEEYADEEVVVEEEGDADDGGSARGARGRRDLDELDDADLRMPVPHVGGVFIVEPHFDVERRRRRRRERRVWVCARGGDAVAERVGPAKQKTGKGPVPSPRPYIPAVGSLASWNFRLGTFELAFRSLQNFSCANFPRLYKHATLTAVGDAGLGDKARLRALRVSGIRGTAAPAECLAQVLQTDHPTQRPGSAVAPAGTVFKQLAVLETRFGAVQAKSDISLMLAVVNAKGKEQREGLVDDPRVKE
ncbi:hypothetical protein FB451DRAFT_1364336 [Mycena latifolia]|nr:hypothetical protein FB451DRAFT_1364336 [Mycena latifolia]